MRLNAIDWGSILGSSVKAYDSVKTAQANAKALQAQVAAMQAQADILAQQNLLKTSSIGGISTNMLMYGAAAVLVLLILKRK